jgi:hypothetical protein
MPMLAGFLGGKFLVKNNTKTKQNSTTAIIETGSIIVSASIMGFSSGLLDSVRLIPKYTFILSIRGG